MGKPTPNPETSDRESNGPAPGPDVEAADGRLIAKPPELLQHLKWMWEHGLRYWYWVLLAAIVVAAPFVWVRINGTERREPIKIADAHTLIGTDDYLSALRALEEQARKDPASADSTKRFLARFIRNQYAWNDESPTTRSICPRKLQDLLDTLKIVCTKASVEIDLSQTDLRMAHMRKFPLEKAKFFGANLEGAFLLGAQLQNAEFVNTNLRNADLREANLTMANFHGCVFDGIKLEAADTRQATGLPKR